MDENTVIKSSPKQNSLVKKQLNNQNHAFFSPILKLLLLNFFISPLLFLLVTFLCHETINIFLSADIIKNNVMASPFYDLLFKQISYVSDFSLSNNYILFYRWLFVGYMIFVVFYNIEVCGHISKLSKESQN
ncbi:hypothetical protein CWO85_02650 [Candidatus Phytoplasma ziziphi]|uniref:Uncharacterized protein n=1 Tax=Ziziphus jujuba witches'-broom phytoplasma TaxID=135727 RepID=A0A660HMX3_ZIZJU|nr:hypothetical protein [Candidatus Phytoplasma ziziphi]AYJ01388.1 hypothetical protein CWO85_02650 [Candidatus Phytoplasma ziziphi]